MNLTQSLEHVAKSYLPSPLARTAKRMAVYPRYRHQVRACRQGYRDYEAHYPHSILFIAGLPKSGTTWLERMISSYPGYHDLLIPDAAAYELAHGGSHNYDLPADIFNRFRQMLVLTKMHVHGSPHNVALLRQAGIKYVVLYRDLRDVAVSYYFYVRQTPWHPDYIHYASLSLPQGLTRFGETLLPAYVAWVRSWHANRDPQLSLELCYEDMLSDTANVLTQVAQHFGLDHSPATIEAIVKAHSFKTLSHGRQSGQQSQHSFFRKGVAGDWRNHFTPALSRLYKQHAGAFLIEFGYETNHAW